MFIRHEQDIVSFDEERVRMVQRETELIEEINQLKAEIKVRGEFKIVQPIPDETIKVGVGMTRF